MPASCEGVGQARWPPTPHASHEARPPGERWKYHPIRHTWGTYEIDMGGGGAMKLIRGAMKFTRGGPMKLIGGG